MMIAQTNRCIHSTETMPPMQLPGHDYVLFLDFDGTLVDIAPEPDAIAVDDRLPGLLYGLQKQFSGRLVILTGRDASDIKTFLPSFSGPIYGSHGLELEFQGALSPSTGKLPDARPLNTAAAEFCDGDSTLLVEPKKWGPAIHFRADPSREPEVRSFLEDLSKGSETLEVQTAKCALELRPSGADKGTAIRDAIDRFGWSGKSAIHIGDDTTDEDAFAAIARIGGFGVKVGDGETQAQYRLPSPQSVYDLLSGWATQHGASA